MIACNSAILILKLLEYVKFEVFFNHKTFVYSIPKMFYARSAKILRE